MRRSITIVGGGAAAVSLLYYYLQQSDQHADLPRVVYLFEGRHPFGTGAAYDLDYSTNLLNTKAGSFTPFHDKPGAFYQWLHTKKDIWHKLYGERPFDEHTYLPRAVFGMYLQECLEDLVRQAANRQIEVVRIGAQVTRAVRSRHGYILHAGYGLRLNTDYVFMCCGTLPAKIPPRLLATSGFVPSPYPVTSLTRKIAKGASVAIVGSRLSCIDAVIGLIEQGHTGKIVMHSRSGYFPCVRGTQGRIQPQLLGFADSLPPTSLAALVDLFAAEVAIQGGEPFDFSSVHPPRDLKDFLRKEIALAASDRIWQAVLYSTNGTIEKIWSSLDEKAKAEFMDRYFSAFMAYRVSIPVENAEKILSFLDSGQLDFIPGNFDIAVSDEGKLSVVSHESKNVKFDYDYVVNATGSPRDVRQIDSQLIESMLQQGIAAPHRHGGINVNVNTYQVIDRDGQADSCLYALGELTNGAFFFTSALEIISRHARLCVTRFAEQQSSLSAASAEMSAA
jgi:uncharacterized NAD(P)/FAD-binding protein YdhS